MFDFDGTIADSLPVLAECLNNHITRYGLKTIANVDSVRDKEAHAIMKELGLSLFKFSFLVQRVRKEVRLKIHTLKPFPHMVEVLTELHQKGIPLGIITSNSVDNVKFFLRTHDIDFFTHVYGGSSIFGKKKVLKCFLRTHAVNASEVVYVGDEARDIDAARYNHVQSAAVTWGFNSERMLRERNPDYVISDPRALLKIKLM